MISKRSQTLTTAEIDLLLVLRVIDLDYAKRHNGKSICCEIRKAVVESVSHQDLKCTFILR